MNGYIAVKEKRYMGKFKIYMSLILLYSLTGIAQNKTIVPTSGAIVFNAKVTITDQKLYNASKKAFIKNL